MPVKRILASLVVVAVPVCAAAQDKEKTSDANTASTGQAQGPMTIERVHNGWAVAPDFKVTRIDGATGRLAGATRQALFRDHFFVFEPQANALVRLTRLLRLDAGVGYRLIDGGDGLDRRLRGISGSVALQIGGVSSNRE